MHSNLEAGFLALSSRAKIWVLARTIHMETIHVRGQYLDHPDDAARIYQSSELIHRLAGFINMLSFNPDKFDGDRVHAEYAASYLAEEIRQRHGQAYLTMLHDWIVEAQAIS